MTVKKRVLMFTATLFVMASSVYAHDHETGRDLLPGGSAPAASDKSSKDAEALLSSCSRQANNLQWRINKLQADMAEKHASPPDREELKKLEQKLKEANEIVKYLKVY